MMLLAAGRHALAALHTKASLMYQFIRGVYSYKAADVSDSTPRSGGR